MHTLTLATLFAENKHNDSLLVTISVNSCNSCGATSSCSVGNSVICSAIFDVASGKSSTESFAFSCVSDSAVSSFVGDGCTVVNSSCDFSVV